MSPGLIFRHTHASSPFYLRLAEETCLPRRRAAALYLHAANRFAYFFCAVGSLAVILILFISGYVATANEGPIPPPSQQAVPLTEESRTVQGYPRRYVIHVVNKGDEYGKLAEYYYHNLHDVFRTHYGKTAVEWKVIQEANRRGEQPPYGEKEIPIANDLRIPLP